MLWIIAKILPIHTVKMVLTLELQYSIPHIIISNNALELLGHCVYLIKKASILDNVNNTKIK